MQRLRDFPPILGPDLPAGTDSDNCIVQVNSSHLFMTSHLGYDGYVLSIESPQEKFVKLNLLDPAEPEIGILKTRCGVDRFRRKVIIIRELK
jgi:hypothetical protein